MYICGEKADINMIRNTLLALALGTALCGQAQESMKAEFCSPFDFPLLLSANFGELRPNHFHNGLDIKTQGVTGKPIHAVADGTYHESWYCMVDMVRRFLLLIPMDILQSTDMLYLLLRKYRNMYVHTSMNMKRLYVICIPNLISFL